MNAVKQTIEIKSSKRGELIDITSKISNIVKAAKVEDGICFIFCPHTTAGLTINENADPSVKSDILEGLEKMLPDIEFSHSEGNSDAHIKASMMGFSLQILIQDGSLMLGTWQGIYFCEFDGPRNRNVHIQILK